MAAASLYLSNAILDHVNRVSSFSVPAGLYLALFTSNPGPGTAAGDPSGTEVSGGSYARQAIAFDAASGATQTSNGAITFPTATAGWGTVTHWAIFDASSSGNLLWYSPLDSSQTINTGTQANFADGAIDLTIS